MSPDASTDFLEELFQARGLKASRHNEWLLPNDRFPAIRGLWYRDNRSLEIQIALGGKRITEALLDNEPWAAGERAVSGAAWPDSRNF